MSFKKTKYIDPINIPQPLKNKVEPEFYIYKLENIDKNVILHYYFDGKGISINMDDIDRFQALPDKIEIISGGWYGDSGRWSPLTRYSGTIICENVKGIKKLSESGTNYKFKIRKSLLSSCLILTIESDKIGVVQIKCKKIVPQAYETLLFDKIEDEWKPRSSFTLNK